jgi:TrmH family RNA methyltransferase
MITSRDNARVKRWAKLTQDARLRRQEGRVIVEGPHLVTEALEAGLAPVALMVSESGLRRADVQRLVVTHEPVVLSDPVFRAIADAEHPQGIAAEIAIPRRAAQGDCVFLEGVQDPSNVGAILRTAAAFGVGEIALNRTCADAWNPKVLRAGMGGHFRLAIREVTDLAVELEGFQGKVVCTVLKGGTPLPQAQLRGRLGWVFGAEGAGVSDNVAARAELKVSIPMAPGTESINVAAAAAICLYSAYAFSRPGAGS